MMRGTFVLQTFCVKLVVENTRKQEASRRFIMADGCKRKDLKGRIVDCHAHLAAKEFDEVIEFVFFSC